MGNQPVRDFCEKRARMLGKRMQIEAVEDQRGKIDHKRRSCQTETRQK